VALLSTGDEVAEPGTAARPGQIYDANRFTLRGLDRADAAARSSTSGSCPTCATSCARGCSRPAGGDVVLTSGGVSVGVYDLVKDVLGEIGAIDFWQVAMQPGRPLAFGRIGARTFFGLPGNPVASHAAFMLFVRPALYKLAGRRRLFPTAAGHGHRADAQEDGRREFKRGIVHRRRTLGGPHHGPRARVSSPRWSPATASSCSRRSAATSPRRDCRWWSLLTARVADPIDDRRGEARRARPRARGAAPPAHLAYADVRLEVAEGKSAAAENGASKFSGDDYGFALGVRVLAGDRMVAPGYVGSRSARPTSTISTRIVARRWSAPIARHGQRRDEGRRAREVRPAGRVAADTRLHPIEVREDTVPAVYAVDPAACRSRDGPLPPTSRAGRRGRSRLKLQLHRHAHPCSRRELFASTEGAPHRSVGFALTQGGGFRSLPWVRKQQELQDVMGHQRGWEVIGEGVAEPLLHSSRPSAISRWRWRATPPSWLRAPALPDVRP
jgi:molybdenum cofactor synthesis domain-containing protein